MADQGSGAPGGARASRPEQPDDIHDDDELAEALAAQLEQLSATGAIPVQRPAAPPAERPQVGSQRIPTAVPAERVPEPAPTDAPVRAAAPVPRTPPPAAAPPSVAAPDELRRPRSRHAARPDDIGESPAPPTAPVAVVPSSAAAGRGEAPAAPPSVSDAVAAAWERSLRSFAAPPIAVPAVPAVPSQIDEDSIETEGVAPLPVESGFEVPHTTGQHAAIRPPRRRVSPYARPAGSPLDDETPAVVAVPDGPADAAPDDDEEYAEFVLELPDDDDGPEPVVGPNPSDIVSRVVTGSVAVITGQIPLRNDDEDGVDDVEVTGFEALPANTASIGVLPPMFQGGPPVTGPTGTTGYVDTEAFSGAGPMSIPAGVGDTATVDGAAADALSAELLEEPSSDADDAVVEADAAPAKQRTPKPPREPRAPRPLKPARTPEARRPAAGFVTSFVIWGGALASPLALVLGFAIAASTGGSVVAIVAVVVAILLTLPGVYHAALAGARNGLGSIGVTRLAFGHIGGVLPGILLLLGRLAGATVVLLGLSQLATSFASRTGIAGSLPDSIPAIVAVVATGLVALLLTIWRPRVVGILLLVFGVLGAIVTVSAVILVAPDAGTATSRTAQPIATAAVAGFVLLGLIAAGSAADIARRPLFTTRASTTALGTVLGVAFGGVVVVVGIVVGTGSGISVVPADALVGALIDATPVALVVPVAVALLVASVTLVAILVRSAGSAAGDLLGPGRSSALGATAAALVAIAVALAVLAGGLDLGSILTMDGPIVAVPAAAWLGVIATTPLRRPKGVRVPRLRGINLLGFCIATAAGLLFVDHLVVASERGPLLTAIDAPADSLLQAPLLLGLVAAFVVGLATGAVSRLAERLSDRKPDLPS